MLIEDVYSKEDILQWWARGRWLESERSVEVDEESERKVCESIFTIVKNIIIEE